jgi:hypothetical protein
MNKDQLDDIMFALNSLFELKEHLNIQIYGNDIDETIKKGELFDFFYNKEEEKLVITIRETEHSSEI